VSVPLNTVCCNQGSGSLGIFQGHKTGPVTPQGGALGVRMYNSYCFLFSALEGGECSASRPGHALPPGKEPPVPTVQEAGGAPEPVWTQRVEEKHKI
jgi:hypothetical protein